MKRILSLTLALVMILGTFTGVFAAEPTVEEAAAKFLAKEEILLGDDNGDLMLKDNLERRDAVILLSRLLGEEEVAAGFPESEESPSWTDVRNDAYYVPFFAWAQTKGYFEGNEDNTFAPREAISAPEYAIVLLRALGYEVNGHESWKASLETAEKIGLLKDVEVEFEDKVVRGQMAVMTLNALGTKMKDSDKTLAEVLNIELPEPDVLEVENVYADNLKEVVVELSNAKLAKSDLENADNYKVMGFVVEKAELNDNVVTLLVNGTFTNNRTYELLVRGLDRELNGRYKFDVRDNAAPYVEEVTVLGEYGIKVTTSEPVVKPAERNFLLGGKNIAMIVEQYGRDIILTPYHNRAFDEGETVLTVGSLTDHAGFKSVKEEFDIEIAKDEEAPVALGAELRGKEITVEFDKDVYEKSIKSGSKGNAYFESGRNKIYATDADKVDTNKVKYTFDRDFSRRADLVIKDVENHSKVAMEETTVNVVEIRDNLEPEVIDYDIYFTAKDKAEVVLTFDKNLDEEVEGSFKLFEKEVKKDNLKLDSDELVADENKVTIELTGLKTKTDYVLEVENFKDTAGNKMYVYYVDFKTPAEVGEFKVVNILTYWNSEEIEIRFNNPVDRYVAELGSNYVFELANGRKVDLIDVDGRVIVERDGKTVTLVVPGLNKKEYNKLTISSSLKDIDGNRLEGEEEYKFGELTPSLETAVKNAKKDAEKYEIDTTALDAAVEAKDAEKVEKELNKVLKEIEEAKKAEEEEKEEELEEAKEALEEEVEAAKSVLAKAEKLEIADINTLKLAISGAEAVLTGEDIESINAAKATLEAAKDEVQAKIDAILAKVALEEAVEAVEALFEDYAAKDALADGVDQKAIDEASAKVNALDDSVEEKAELAGAIVTAQELLAKLALEEAVEAVKALFKDYATKDELADGVDQETIDAASAKVNALDDSVVEKAELISAIATARRLLAE